MNILIVEWIINYYIKNILKLYNDSKIARIMLQKIIVFLEFILHVGVELLMDIDIK